MLGGVALICVAAVVVVLVGRSLGQKKLEGPAFESEIASLQLVKKADVERPGKPDATATIQLKNEHSQAIIAISCAQGSSSKDSLIFNEIGIPGGKYRIIGPANDVFSLKVQMGNLKDGFPIRIVAVIYEDGTGAGEDDAIVKLRTEVDKLDNRLKGAPVERSVPVPVTESNGMSPLHR